MRRSGVLLLVTMSLLAMFVPAAHASVATRTVTVHIPRLERGAVVTIEPTHAMVNFGGPFTSIQALSFHVVFEGDLLDPGETFFYDFDKLGGQGVWPSGSPVSELTFTPNPETYHYWLDGHEVIHPAMVAKLWDHDDSVRIVDFTATIVGVR